MADVVDLQGHLVLPRGTRVVLTAQARDADGVRCPSGSPARVEEVDHPTYVVSTPGGRRVTVRRSGLAIQKGSVAAALMERAEAWERYAPCVALSAVVGSTAWGLASADSDVDRKGAFLLPFADHAGLRPTPAEIRALDTDAQYQEVEPFIRKSLAGDVNAIEVLFSPRVEEASAPGQWLLDARGAFLSRRVYRSFGRYAMGQLDKLRKDLAWKEVERVVVEVLQADPDLDRVGAAVRLSGGPHLPNRGQARRALERMARSLFDRDLIASSGYPALRAFVLAEGDRLLEEQEPAGAKNVYNLLRILHSGVRCLQDGEPMVVVPAGPLRERLLAVKARAVPLAEVLQEAEALAADLESAYASSELPERPDLDAADALLVRCRTWAAERALGEGA